MRRILFLTLLGFTNLENRGIYPDLLREFVRRGDIVYVVSPIERKNNKKTHIVKEDSWEILKVRTGNIQQTNLIEKGIATVLLEQQFINAIKKYYSNTKFDLVLIRMIFVVNNCLHSCSRQGHHICICKILVPS